VVVSFYAKYRGVPSGSASQGSLVLLKIARGTEVSWKGHGAHAIWPSSRRKRVEGQQGCALLKIAKTNNGKA